MTENIPKDPAMLLSFVNMKLRDFYPTLDALCTDLNVEKEQLESVLSGIDYIYDPGLNQFV